MAKKGATKMLFEAWPLDMKMHVKNGVIVTKME